MQRYDIKGPITDDTLNKTNTNFKTLFDEYTAAGLNALDAKNKANEAIASAKSAVATAKAAKSETESTQAQLDVAIIKGDSSVEAAAARVGTDGKMHSTLKTRLDVEMNKTNQQLADTTAKSDSALDMLVNDLSNSAKGVGSLEFVATRDTIFKVDRFEVISPNVNLETINVDINGVTHVEPFNELYKINNYNGDVVEGDKKYTYAETLTLDGTEPWSVPGSLIEPSAATLYCFMNHADMARHYGRPRGNENVISFNSDYPVLEYNTFPSTMSGGDYEGIAAGETTVRLKVSKSKLSSVDITGLRTYLKSNPIKVKIYKFAPEVSTIPERTYSLRKGDEVKVSSSGLFDIDYTLRSLSKGESNEKRGIRIASWNLWAHTAYQPPLLQDKWQDKQKRLIHANNVDIIGIQEVYEKSDTIQLASIPASLSSSLLPYYSFNKAFDMAVGAYGVGVLSKYPISGVETHKLTSSSEEQRILGKSVIDVNGETLSLYVTHIDYNHIYRPQQITEIFNIVKADKSMYKIIVGDFNTDVVSELDVFKSEFNVMNGYGGVTRATHDNGRPLDNMILSKNIKLNHYEVLDHDGLSDHKLSYVDVEFI